jgi:hypothetical protein
LAHRSGSTDAFATLNACIAVNLDFKKACILKDPAPQAERADPHAVKTVMNQSKGKDDTDNDRRRYAEVPFEQFERIKIAVNRLVAKSRNPA